MSTAAIRALAREISEVRTRIEDEDAVANKYRREAALHEEKLQGLRKERLELEQAYSRLMEISTHMSMPINQVDNER